MNARLQLDDYLHQARQRLQWILSAQSAAVLVAALLAVTLVAAALLWSFAFSDGAALLGRIALAAAVAASVAWFIVRRRRLRAGAGAASLERALPEQSGRVATYLQESAKAPGSASVLIDLLAEDAQRIADREPLATTIPAQRIWLPAAAAMAAVALFATTFFLGGAIGEGARHLWLGRLPPAASVAAAAGGIAVKPGDATVRRNQDLDIAALVAGGSNEVQVHVRFDSADDWEVTPMERNAEGGFDFTLYAVRDAARYYVTAGRLKSAEHRIDVVDLPTIEKLRLVYDYPGWTGLPKRTEESGGDVRAVAGTKVSVEVETNEPLTGPLLVINGSDSGLSQNGKLSRGDFAVKQEGHYRIATRFGDEIVPLTPDYLIEVVADEKPDVKIVRPGRDYRATSIEEVPVRVQAKDDFRLEALELHYSVNGGDWRSEPLPAGSPDIEAAAMLRLEEMQKPGPRGESPLLVPGDLVSYYALAKDHQHSVQTDLFLIQVQPFEQRYTQGQAAGGGGGGGGGGEEDGDISRKQKEVLLATWNLQRGQDGATGRDAERTADNARMLADVQQTLADQANTLVARARARALTGQDAAVAQFVKSLEDAARAMAPAAKSLADMKLETAVKHEQEALTHLLRAESAFRDIQVVQQQRGGGGGGGSQAGRDLAEMTELELDLEKNQYETEPQMSAQQRSQAEDEATRKLRELARRQEQLAREAARNPQLAQQQRWQQEQLRRELEEVRRQLEQMAQQQSQQGGQQSQSQSGSQQSGSQQQSASSGQQSGSQQSGSQSGQQSARQAAAAEAERQVAQALEQMRNGNAERASEQLNRAGDQIERGRQQAERERISNLADRAGEVADQARAAERNLRAAVGNNRQQGSANPNRDQGMTYEQMDRLAGEKRDLQAAVDDMLRQMDAAQRQAGEETPRAARAVGEARREVLENDIIGSIARSARDIERGRGAQAAAREALITDTLDRLQQSLQSAADTAAAESGRRQRQGTPADVGQLQAELADLRRAMEQARQGMAQNQSGNGEAGANAPNAREGQSGQDGGQQGQQGQGQQGGQDGPGGTTPGQQGGANGGANGGIGNFGIAGAGGDNQRGGVEGRFVGGRQGVPAAVADRRALEAQAQISGDRLAQLLQQMRNGLLPAADAALLQQLTQRLQRGGIDPMSSEYPRIVALVSQLELSALKAQQAEDPGKSTRAGETVDDSRRYRDNVAEYYRRLGGGNE